MANKAKEKIISLPEHLCSCLRFAKDKYIFLRREVETPRRGEKTLATNLGKTAVCRRPSSFNTQPFEPEKENQIGFLHSLRRCALLKSVMVEN
tara:strand:+ start:352 stop:630 length:279 start_codon:yes stop_codon:yes gene_type:complete